MLNMFFETINKLYSLSGWHRGAQGAEHEGKTYPGPDLVATLTNLKLYDFSHGGMSCPTAGVLAWEWVTRAASCLITDPRIGVRMRGRSAPANGNYFYLLVGCIYRVGLYRPRGSKKKTLLFLSCRKYGLIFVHQSHSVLITYVNLLL